MPKTLDEVITKALKIQELRRTISYRKRDISSAKLKLDGFVEKCKERVSLSYFDGLNYANLYDSNEKPSNNVINAIIADLNHCIKEKEAYVAVLEEQLQGLEDSLLK